MFSAPTCPNPSLGTNPGLETSWTHAVWRRGTTVTVLRCYKWITRHNITIVEGVVSQVIELLHRYVHQLP